MLPGADRAAKRSSSQAGRGLKIRTFAVLLVVAAVIFMLSAVLMVGTMDADDDHSNLLPVRKVSKRIRAAAVAAVATARTAAHNAADPLQETVAAAKQTVRSTTAVLRGKLAAAGAARRVRSQKDCRDSVTSCSMWAEAGECAKNPGYMRPNCPKSCDACQDVAKKNELCHRPRSRPPLLRRGGVDATFRRVVGMGWDTAGTQPEVVVHSRPPKGPWVITIENFLAEHEIRALMEKGGHHFERSLAGDGVSPVRTSKTSWCNVPFCETDPVIRSVKSRVANVTGVPTTHSEHVQVLQYDPGDFYRQHHDQNAATHSPWGPRLFTFFTYLSTVPAGGGGGTRFSHLNLTVEAKRGRAVFWPSVLDDDPSGIRVTSDQRTTHEALTVTKGQKFAANMWLHQFDFQTTLAAGCRNEDLAEWRPSSAAEADEEPPPEVQEAEEVQGQGDKAESSLLEDVYKADPSF